MRWITVLVAGFLAVSAGAVELPDTLKQLEPAFASADTLVDALRDLDKQQNQAASALYKEGEALSRTHALLLDEAASIEKAGDAKGAEAKRAEAQAKKLQAEAKLDEAKQAMDLVRMAYEAGLEKYQDSAKLHNFYGELLYDAYQDEPGGLREWHKAISLDSGLSNPYNNLGIHYFHVGSYELGLENLDRALKLEPKNPDYNYNMAQMYAVYFPQIEELRGWKPKKIYRELMKHSEKAIEASPAEYDLLRDYAMNFYLADKFDVAADWEKAAATWKTAYAAAPNDAEKFNCLLNEGRAWMNAKKRSAAIAPLEQALALRPNSDAAKNILAKAREGE